MIDMGRHSPLWCNRRRFWEGRLRMTKETLGSKLLAGITDIFGIQVFRMASYLAAWCSWARSWEYLCGRMCKMMSTRLCGLASSGLCVPLSLFWPSYVSTLWMAGFAFSLSLCLSLPSFWPFLHSSVLDDPVWTVELWEESRSPWYEGKASMQNLRGKHVSHWIWKVNGLYFSCPYVCSVCTCVLCVCICMGTCTCICPWRPKDEIPSFTIVLRFIYWNRIFGWTQSQFLLVYQAWLFWESPASACQMLRLQVALMPSWLLDSSCGFKVQCSYFWVSCIYKTISPDSVKFLPTFPTVSAGPFISTGI